MNAYSRGAKKRAKRGKRALEALQERVQDAITIVEQDKPLETVLWARANQMGVEPTDDLLRPIFGDHAGQAIEVGAKDKAEEEKLWRLFKSYHAVRSRYLSLCFSASVHPKSISLGYVPERFETRADDCIDIRDEDTKVRQIRKANANWEDAMMSLKWHERALIVDAVDCKLQLHKGGDLTVTGIAFVAALRVLMEVVEK